MKLFRVMISFTGERTLLLMRLLDGANALATRATASTRRIVLMNMIEAEVKKMSDALLLLAMVGKGVGYYRASLSCKACLHVFNLQSEDQKCDLTSEK
jgi:hypothetical protein